MNGDQEKLVAVVYCSPFRFPDLILSVRRDAMDLLRLGRECIRKGAQMPDEKYYHTSRHKEWAAKVLKRAGYLCEECKRYGRLDKDGLPVKAKVAHHIKNKDDYPELRYKLSNGKALCDKCHNKAHPEKGGGRNRYSGS